MNQKEWGIHFLNDIKKVGDEYLASLPFGETPFKLDTDKKSGAIDLYWVTGKLFQVG